jgi:hypothetical protein
MKPQLDQQAQGHQHMLDDKKSESENTPQSHQSNLAVE